MLFPYMRDRNQEDNEDRITTTCEMEAETGVM